MSIGVSAKWRLLALAACWWTPGAVGAQTKAGPRVLLEGDAAGCPSPRALGEALTRLIPSVEVTSASEAGVFRVEITDLGKRYRLRVGGGDRELAEPARRCEERARAAAVLVALVLQPPSL